MKIRSPQTMGVAVPLPGSFTFQRTFEVSLQVTGGSALGAVPVSSGPRHPGQLCAIAARNALAAAGVVAFLAADGLELDRDVEEAREAPEAPAPWTPTRSPSSARAPKAHLRATQDVVN